MGWEQVFGRHLFVFSSHNSSVIRRDTESRTVTLGEVFQNTHWPYQLDSARSPRTHSSALLFPVLQHDRAAVPLPPRSADRTSEAVMVKAEWWRSGGLKWWWEERHTSLQNFPEWRASLAAPPRQRAGRWERKKFPPPSHTKKIYRWPDSESSDTLENFREALEGSSDMGARCCCCRCCCCWRGCFMRHHEASAAPRRRALVPAGLLRSGHSKWTLLCLQFAHKLNQPFFLSIRADSVVRGRSSSSSVF